MCHSTAGLDPRGAGQGSDLPGLTKPGQEQLRFQQRAPNDISEPLLPGMAEPFRLQLEVAINHSFVSGLTILRANYNVCLG